MPSHRSPTIIVLYDHNCPLQRDELLALKANDRLAQIKLINIRDAAFSAHAWGFAPQALETTLHVRDLAGHWHIAMDAFHLLYQAVGLMLPLAREVNHADLRDLRFVFDKVDVQPSLHVLKRRTSNDDCLIAEASDSNAGLNPLQLGYGDA